MFYLFDKSNSALHTHLTCFIICFIQTSEIRQVCIVAHPFYYRQFPVSLDRVSFPNRRERRWRLAQDRVREETKLRRLLFQAKRAASLPRLRRASGGDLRGRECAREPEGHFARHLRVNPAWYGDGGSRPRPPAPPSSATSSQSPTFVRATDVYTGCSRKSEREKERKREYNSGRLLGFVNKNLYVEKI